MAKTKVGLVVIPGGRIPSKESAEAACSDAYAREVEYKEGGNYCIVKLGVKPQIPAGFKVVEYPRSSISKIGWVLCNSVGIIDSDYTGEIQARFRRLVGGAIMPFAEGDRVCQLSIEKVEDACFEEIDEITKVTERGENGHGHTGKK